MILKFKNILGEFNFTSKFKLSKRVGEKLIDENNILKYNEVFNYFKQDKFLTRFYTENLKITLNDLESSKDDEFMIRETVKDLDNLYKAKIEVDDHNLEEVVIEKEIFLESLMERHCPNLLTVAGSVVGARLIQLAGSLKKLSRMTARKVQVLGAEGAFFKSLMSGKGSGKGVKYGVVYLHDLVTSLNQTNKKNKVARLLSDKIVIAARVDFFKGEFVGNQLREQVEDKI